MRFGHYELFDRFAVGDMAELYMGRAQGEQGFEKPVAIKLSLSVFTLETWIRLPFKKAPLPFWAENISLSMGAQITPATGLFSPSSNPKDTQKNGNSWA